jgi:hypothetical protein
MKSLFKYLIFCFITHAIICSHENELKTAIGNLNIVKTIAILENSAVKSERSQDVLTVVQEELQKRKQATKSIFRSPTDLCSILKSAALGYIGYNAIKLGFNGLDLMDGKTKTIDGSSWGLIPTLNVQDMISGAICGARLFYCKNGLWHRICNGPDAFDHKLTEIQSTGSTVSKSLIAGGMGLMAFATKKMVEAFQKKSAHENLAKIRAIESYVNKL